MANFNPGLNPTSDPDYNKAPRDLSLVETEGRNKEISSRQFAEGLFAAAKGGVVGLDNVLQESSKSELQSDYERLNGAQGVDLAAGAAVVNPENTVYNPTASSPNGIPTADQRFLAEGMERLGAAKEQGKISNTHYYAQLEAMVRNVKSRYPGYSEIIDRQIEGIAGVKPANALRSSMLHDLETAANAKAEKLTEKERFILNHAQFATQADRDHYQAGDYDVDKMISIIQSRKGATEDLNTRTAELTYKAKSSEFDQGQAELGAGGVLESLHTLGLDDIKTLTDQARKDDAAGTFDPARYAVEVQAGRLKYVEEASKRLHAALDGKLPATKINSMIEESAKRYDDYAAVFTKEGSGMLNILSTRLAAEKDKDTLKIIGSPIGVNIRALIQAGKISPELARDMWNKMGEAASNMNRPNMTSQVVDVLGKPVGPVNSPAAKTDPVVSTMIFDNKVGIATGASGFNDPKKLIVNLHKVGKDQPVNVEMVLNSWHDNLTNPAYPDTFVKESARALFSEGNKDFLQFAFKDFDSRKRGFELLTSPQVTTAMEKLKGQPEYKAYQEWAYDNYTNILKHSVNALGEVARRPYLDLKFDENTGHFSLVPNAEGQRVMKEKGFNGVLNVATKIEDLLGRGLSDNVRMLNSATDNVKKIMDSDGHKVGGQIKNLAAALANANLEDKTGVWPWLVKSLQLPDSAMKDLDNLEFGGTHPNFTKASGTNGEPRGVTSLIEDASVPSEVRVAAKEAYAKGMDLLQTEGSLPKHIAQGFMANFKVESGFSPSIKGDKGLAIGLAQWHPNRQAEFKRYWGKELKSATYEEQLRFVLWELDHMEARAKQKIMKARTAAEAAALVDQYYERSSGEHRQKRINQAQAYAAED